MFVRTELCLTVTFTLGGAVGIADLATLGGALVSTLGDVLGAAVGLRVGVAFLATLRDVLGAVAAFEPVAFLPVTVLNISTNFFNAATLLSQMLNVDAGAGLFSAAMRSQAACVASSAEFTPGIRTAFGKNSTVSPIRSPLVAGMYALWHR